MGLLFTVIVMKLICAAEQVRLGKGVTYGFLGEVPVSQLTDGVSLAAALGFTAGKAINSNEPWLHFIDPVDGKTKFIAKKPYRCNFNWNNLSAAGLIYGDRTITLDNKTYRVRLLKTAVGSDYIGARPAADPVGAFGSEWNRLLYRLIPDALQMPLSGISEEGIVFGEWADYTEDDLSMYAGSGNEGYQTFCMESIGSERIVRGTMGVRYLNHTISTYTSVVSGWRPVLELVE